MEIENFCYNESIKLFFSSITYKNFNFLFSSFSAKFPFNLHADGNDKKKTRAVKILLNEN